MLPKWGDTMKWLKALGLSAVFVFIAAIIGLRACTHSADPRAWRVAVDAWRLNHGWVSINAFDWGTLKLRSGKYGLAALEDLKRHGSTDDIRITADAVLRSYTGTDSMCGDAPCGKESSFRDFNPSPQANLFRMELLPGQKLPHEFIVQTANNLRESCPIRLDDCVLRMQDFNGDGQEEVYVEAISHINEDGTSPEDEMRRVTIYTDDPEKGWDKFPRLLIVNYDAATWPQRPFKVEFPNFDTALINGYAFQLMGYRQYAPFSEMAGQKPSNALMKPMAAFIDQVPVIYPRDGRIPAHFTEGLKRGVEFQTLSRNPLLRVNYGSPRFSQPGRPQYSQPVVCRTANSCRAIVADLNHDRRDDIILIALPSDKSASSMASLIMDEGRNWRVMSNVELCRDIIPDIDKAKIEFERTRWGLIRLGDDLYPTWPVPHCEHSIVELRAKGRLP